MSPFLSMNNKMESVEEKYLRILYQDKRRVGVESLIIVLLLISIFYL